MSSITGSVGADGGFRIPPLAASTQIKANSSWVITSIYDPAYQAQWTQSAGFIYVPFEYGWRAFTFQLIVPGGGNGPCTISATNDPVTAQGVNGLPVVGAVWEPVSAAMTGFSNPMTLQGTAHILYVNSGPWTAFRMSTAGGFSGSVGSYLLFGAAS